MFVFLLELYFVVRNYKLKTFVICDWTKLSEDITKTKFYYNVGKIRCCPNKNGYSIISAKTSERWWGIEIEREKLSRF